MGKFTKNSGETRSDMLKKVWGDTLERGDTRVKAIKSDSDSDSDTLVTPLSLLICTLEILLLTYFLLTQLWSGRLSHFQDCSPSVDWKRTQFMASRLHSAHLGTL